MWIANDLENPVFYQSVLGSIDPPMPGVVRTTTLIGPPLIPHLVRTRGDEIVLGASDFIAAWLGKCCHAELEKAAVAMDMPCIIEQRWQREVLGLIVSGASDFYLKAGIRDWKTTSTVKATKPYANLYDWECQLNTYGWLMEPSGYPVRTLAVWALLKDWNVGCKFRKDKPNVPYIKRDLKLWTPEFRMKYVEGRARIHLEDPIPDCTPADTWQTGPNWAVMQTKPKKKKAIKLHTSPQAASVHVENLAGKAKKGEVYKVEARPMERPRCKSYCPARFICERNIHRTEILPELKKLEGLERTKR